ncbi:MAG: hypothetical protein HFE82_04875, partial [Erysipelotrichaceae bacterium]|nr:hypothetical protein [Erysipelotrichaceae bacterium]
MWKKLLIALTVLAGTLSVGYAVFADQMDAAPSAAKFYKSWYNAQGGTERNGSATHFKMGGEDWWFAYEDNGTMYISSTTGSEKNCALKASGQPNATEVESCIPQARQHFSQNLNDDDDELGKLIFNNSANGLNSATPVMLDYNLYNKMSQNETDFNSLSGLVWLDEKYNGYRVAFTKGPGGYNQRYKLPNYKNLFTSQTVNQANLTFFFAIQTPQYNMVDSISAAMKINTISYSNSKNAANEIVTEIDTTNGEGPYHFFVHDTDASGSSGNYLTPSQYFDITGFSNDGRATVTMKNKLPVGDYYFRVTVRDESTNQLLYYSPDNMDSDKFRRKETNVLHVQITKGKPKVSFDSNDKGTTYVTGDALNPVTHSEHATHDHPEISPNDVEIEYTVITETPGLLVSGLPYTSMNAGDGPTLTFASNMSGTIKIQARVAGDANYEDAITEKTIIVQLGITANYVETKTNIKAGSAEAKPPTSYVQGNRIGYVDVSGGVIPYTYSLPS